MFARIMLTALAAGAIAGVFVWGAHMVKTTPLILAAEVYEGAGEATPAQGNAGGAPHQAQTEAEDEEWAPGEGLERAFYTFLTDVLTAIGFAFALTGGIALSGRPVDWRRGILWGLGGFAAFYLSPAFGLAPELPGMQAAGLGARQLWWIATVAGTAGGLALICFAPRLGWKLVGAALIVAPHVIGPPRHAIEPGTVPAELAAEFAVATLVVAALFWMLLGALAGHLYGRRQGA